MTDASENVVPLNDSGPRYREPPHNTEVEAALLGALLTNNRAFEQVAGLIEPEHFREPLHQLIWSAAADMIDQGKTASPITLRHMFADDDDRAYLGELVGAAIDATAARQYADHVVALHRAREAIGIFEAAQEELYRNGDLSRETIEQTIEQTALLIETDGAGSGMRPLSKIHDDTLDEIDRDRKGDRPAAVRTGLADLDRRFNGLLPGDLTILGARPSMGKSALGLNVAEHCARENGPALFFSLEMRDLQLARRQLAGQSGVATEKMTGWHARDLSQTDLDALMAARDRCRGLPLWIDDTAWLTVATIYARAKRLQRRHGLSLIVVDYLQLVKASAEARRKSNDTSEITEISGGLKNVAKRLDVPVLALSQLSRNLETRNNKRPMLADLRQSGSIEQDADNVLFLYRDEYYLERDLAAHEGSRSGEKLSEYQRIEGALGGARNIAEIAIAKQRQGPAGVKVDVHFDSQTQTFGDLARDGEGLL